jgi:cysteine desulfurase family protein (TIGR01976 family)
VTVTFNVDRLRARMPALESGTAFFDGPGGTQTPDIVADVMAAAMKGELANRARETQAGRNADDIVVAARQAMADLLGADPRGIVFDRSMTSVAFMVARTLSKDWAPGDEIIVSRLDHDGDVRPWVTYAERVGATVRWIDFDPKTGEISLDQVRSLVNENTRVLAITGASNVIGTRPPLAAIAEIVHASSALFFVDGVHLTAHAFIDIEAIGADFYACSPYKFLGPHIGVLAASPALLESMHPDKLKPSTEDVPERFELGTLPYELLAGVVAAVDVLADLVPGDEATMSRRARIERSMSALEIYEEGLHAQLREGLALIPGVRLYSQAHHRTPTEFFTFDGHDSAAVSFELARRGINAPAGSFYGIEPCEWLGLGKAGAIRAGLAPYSSTGDVERLLEALSDIVGV